jgi:hypothetical protein
MQRETLAATRLIGFALIYHAMDRGAESDAALREMENVAASDLNPFWFAAVHAYRGEIDQAFFSWLNRAYQAHDFWGHHPRHPSRARDPVFSAGVAY